MTELRNLLKNPSVSGYEYKNIEYIKELLNKNKAKVISDNIFNVIAERKGKTSKFKILLDAHMDTVGLMVSKITEDGFVCFVGVGGVDPRILPSMEVTIHGEREITGVIGVKPPHLLKSGTDKAYKISDLFIDTGYAYNELVNLVKVGDIISFNSDFTVLANNMIACNGLDDKVGIYILCKILERVNNENIDLYFVATVGEEIGLKGAKAIGNTYDFDLAIVIDVTFGKTPDGIPEMSFDVGKGPVITLSPSLSGKYNKDIIKFAGEKEIPLFKEVEGGNTGTNAWAYHSSGVSIPSVMISVPLKYMHTSYEVVSKDDIDNAISLVSEYLNERFRGE